MLITCIFLYLFINLLMGFWASQKVHNASDFALAGRHLSLGMACTSIFATWFGSETVMSSSVEFAEGGILAVIKDPFGAALCLFLTGRFIARPLYKMQIITISDYFEIRYNKKVAYFSAAFISISYLGWIAAQLQAMGIILSVVSAGTFLETSIFSGICWGAFLVMIYTMLGGMWSVSLTDFIQTIVIILGLLIVAITLLWSVEDWSVMLDSQPEGFFSIIPEPSLDAWVIYVAAWITVGLGSLPSQDVVQRVLSAKDEKTAVRASYFAGGMYLVFAFFPLVIGLSAKYLYPGFMNGESDLLIPKTVLAHSPVFIQILFFGALLSAIMSTTSGAILAPATLVAENLIRPFNKEMSDDKMLKLLRLCVFIITILAIYMASSGASIYELAAQSSTFTLVSLVAPLLLGLYWKKANDTGALVGMILGLGIWVLMEYILQYPESYSLIGGTIASFVTMLGLGILNKKEKQVEVQEGNIE